MNRRGPIARLLGRLRQGTLREPLGLSATEFERAFVRERALADRTLRSFSMIVLVDRDPGEDQRLNLAQILRERLRASDCVGRLGSDTVAVLLPETDEACAFKIADSLVHLLAEAGLKFDYNCFVYPGKNGNGERDWLMPSNGAATNGNPNNGNGAVPTARNGDAAPNEPKRNGHAPESAEASPSPERNGRAPLHEMPPGDSLDDHEGAAIVATPSPLDNDSPWKELSEIRERIGASRAQDLRALCCEPVSLRRRALDIAVAATLLAVLSPIFLVAALTIKLTSPGPIFFRQKRAGQRAIPFDFYKFRSMYIDAEERKKALAPDNEQSGPIFKMKNDPRMTPLGRFLRRSSIDELPQLFNVLRGDMTLVGPRPPTLDEVEEYEPWQLARLSVKGGLTCIWQVSGRSEIGFDEWVRMDLRYAMTRGMVTDLSLLARTPVAVATGRGAY